MDSEEILIKSLAVKLMTDEEINNERLNKVKIFIDHGIRLEDLLTYSALITESTIRMYDEDVKSKGA